MTEEIDRYDLIKLVGKGGMGEVFLAKDTKAGRSVALKRIREELKEKPRIQLRFLREARLSAQLCHPGIMPIYEIGPQFYTMPYVEGDSLKQLLRRAQEREKDGLPDPLCSSIPSLMRLFLQVCQAVFYAHTRGVLHRDLKSDNILIGRYGEVLIADWGLAQRVGEPETPLEEGLEEEGVTLPGKIPGTISHMAPERALGEPASVQTDIYALGVLLYQLLTLRLPFRRESLKEFRRTMQRETLKEPVEVAPYREIPEPLVRMVKRSLAADPKERYDTLAPLIAELERAIEGKSKWEWVATLVPTASEGWENRRLINSARTMAMISTRAFAEMLRIETTLCFSAADESVALLLALPEPGEQGQLEEGLTLQLIGGERLRCRMMRGAAELLRSEGTSLEVGRSYHLLIEKHQLGCRLWIDGLLELEYLCYLPMQGGRVGLMVVEAPAPVGPLRIFSGSWDAMVRCLAVPDSLLVCGEYDRALAQYRRIRSSFPGRSEAKDAAFRAGLTLLKQALGKGRAGQRELLLLAALDEFSLLQQIPLGAPLEYLGKALIYQATGEIEEEIKCLELGLRKYPKHPTRESLVDHILFRMHESGVLGRASSYRFALLGFTCLKERMQLPAHRALLEGLTESLKALPFFGTTAWKATLQEEGWWEILALAYALGKPISLLELLEQQPPLSVQRSALLLLLDLGAAGWVARNLEGFPLPPLEKSLLKWAAELLAAPPRSRGSLMEALVESVASDAIKTLVGEWTMRVVREQLLDNGQEELVAALPAMATQPETGRLSAHYLKLPKAQRAAFRRSLVKEEERRLYRELAHHERGCGQRRLAQKWSEEAKRWTKRCGAILDEAW